MPIGLSDGSYYEDELAVVANEPSYQVTRENDVTVIKPATKTASEPFDIGTIETKEGPKFLGEDPVKAAELSTGERHQMWPEKLFRAAYEGFTAPGDVAAGKLDPASPEAAGRAFELASTLVFGPMPLVNKMVDGTLGVFAGVSSKTFPKQRAMRLEKELKETGIVDIDDVWNKYGLFTGADGKLRYEISDHYANFRPLSASQQKDIRETALPLKDVLDHADLYRAYPEIKNVPVIVDKSLDGGAMFKGGAIILSEQAANSKPTILHEIQHWIQRKEEFAKGGAPADDFLLRFEADIDKLGRQVHKSTEKILRGQRLTEDELKDIVKYNKLIDKNQQRREIAPRLANMNYHKLAGEVEAYNVMDRLNPYMGMTHPRHTERVPRSQQVVAQTPQYATPYGYGDPFRPPPYGGPKTQTEIEDELIDLLSKSEAPSASKPADFRRAANDNTPLDPSQGKDPFQLPSNEIKDIVDRATKDARETWASGIADSKDFIKDWDAMHEYGQTLKGKNYTELNVARYNKMRKDIAEKYDIEYNPIEYDPNPFDKYPEVKAAKERADKAYEDIKKDIEALKAKYPEEDFTPAFIRRFLEWIRGDNKKD